MADTIQEQFDKIDAEIIAKIEKPENRGRRAGVGDYHFKKGESGNPKGRPKGSLSIVAALKKKLNKIDPKSRKRYLDLFVDKYIDMAIVEGKEQTMKTIINYTDGMPDQKIDMDFAVSKIVINDPNKPLLDNPNADATINLETEAKQIENAS